MGYFELGVVWDNVHLNTFLIRIKNGVAVTGNTFILVFSHWLVYEA
jgi:hypothetical protein